MELNQKTKNFILRRTQEVNNKYLPSKQEIVLLCQLTELQSELYSAAVDFWESKRVLNSMDIKTDLAHLSVMMCLKKICNHPSLITQTSNANEEMISENSKLIQHLTSLLPDWEEMGVKDSSKLHVVEEILKTTFQNKEKIILVSYFTQTLDMLAGLCDHHNFTYSRLDGSTPTNQRMDIVNKFNDKQLNVFVFLLSARAGGVDLNLTGASRLILYDSDWNPASDLQAMSRIWRDGQTNNNVYIYRLLTAGTIEEKIFQRQISKTGLSSAVVDPQNANGIKLSDKELKDLFTLHYDVDSLTHKQLNCDCDGSGLIPSQSEEDEDIEERDCQLGVKVDKKSTLRMNELGRWEHHYGTFNQNIMQELAIDNIDVITFMFRNKCEMN